MFAGNCSRGGHRTDPCLLALQSESERNDVAIAEAMRAAAEGLGITGRVYITSPTDRGAYVVKADPPMDVSNGIQQF